MKKALLLILSVLLFNCAKSQVNLVPNPSFEDTLGCPSNFGEINKADGWFGFSADYYNSCNNSGYGTPLNYYGFQKASTGIAYCGLATFHSMVSNYREFVQTNLNTTLIFGKRYYASIKVVFSSDSASAITTDKMGMLFSTYKFVDTVSAQIKNYAQVYSTKIISDTNKWSIISGTFIADSGYNYVAIGNFFDDNHTNRFGNIANSYYYIDDVCVSSDSLGCDMATNVNYIHDLITKFHLFPNPTSGILQIALPFDNYSISITNSTGQILFHDDLIYTTEYLQDVSKLNDGIYFLTIQTSKFIKQSE